MDVRRRERLGHEVPGTVLRGPGLDAGGTLAREEPVEALAQDLDGRVRDEPLVDDEEAIAKEGAHLLVGEVRCDGNGHVRTVAGSGRAPTS
jgi:hypothetical protein